MCLSTSRSTIAPAIHYAREGWPLHPAILVSFILRRRRLMRDAWARRALWLRDGRPALRARGVRNPALGAMSSGCEQRYRLAKREQASNGPHRFYEGLFAAETIDQVFARERSAAIVRANVSAASQPGYDMPAGRRLTRPRHPRLPRGITICKPPLGQGLSWVADLGLLNGFIRSARSAWGHVIHLMVEAAKLAFADRDAFSVDPAFGGCHWSTFSARTTTSRRKLIGQASAEIRPGHVPGSNSLVRTARTEPHSPSRRGRTHRNGGPARPGDTCHIDVIDRWETWYRRPPRRRLLQKSPAIPS